MIAPVAPLPTVAVIAVALTTLKAVAALPPNFTPVAPVKLVPVMVTTVPVPPLLGENEVMIGAGMNVKAPVLLAVPPGVVTVIVPVVPLPTVAFRVVALVTLKEAAATPPKVTAVTPVKLVPVMVTTVPAAPLLGENEVIVGAGMKVKVPVLVAVPPGLVTVIAPLAPLPTVAVIALALTTLKVVAAWPPMATTVVPVKLLPVMVTTVPVPPLLGENEVIVGAEMTVKVPELIAVPPGVVTVIVPVVPLPTVAVMEVSLTTVKTVAGVPPKDTAVAPVK